MGHRQKTHWKALFVATLYLWPAFCFSEELLSAPPPLPATPSLSGTIYVSDDLQIALRTGASTKYRITAFLTSGTALKVLKSSDKWVEVEVIETKKTGWVDRQYIQTQLGAKAVVVKKNKALTQAQAQITALTTANKDIKTQLDEAQKSLSRISDQFDRLNKEYESLQAISQEAIDNHDKLQNMREEAASLKAQAGETEIAYALLKQDNYNRGMIHALIAVIFGILITLLIPRLKRKRSSNGWD